MALMDGPFDGRGARQVEADDGGMMPDLRLAAALTELDRARNRIAILERQHRLDVMEIPIPSVRRAVEAVAKEWDVPATALVSTIRTARIAEPRQVVMWIAHEHLGHSQPRIGHCLLRDPTTVLHGVRVVAARMDRDPDFAARVKRIAGAIPTRIKEAL